MTKHELIIGICGSGGDGIMTLGDLLTASVAHEGLNAFQLKSIGPQIRGGESAVKLRISDMEIPTAGDYLDILACLSWKDFVRFRRELVGGNQLIVIHDAKDPYPQKDSLIIAKNIAHFLEFPVGEIAKDTAGTLQAKNMVLAGILCGMFNIPYEGLLNRIKRKFGAKKSELIETNTAAFHEGFRQGADKKESIQAPSLTYSKSQPKILISGNEAIAYGALVAGCEFFAGYPITPASEIMEWLSVELFRFNQVMVQAEDEIAALGMVIGASFAGKKAMTATSGPGLALMTELISLASVGELPCIIVDVQRAGPSTGIPTKSEQGDLFLSLYGSHGDAPRVVVAPCDVEDCFQLTIDAFYIAEKYQIPVIILSDQDISQRLETISKIDFDTIRKSQRITPNEKQLEDYRRFSMIESDDGVSPMTFLGIPGGEYIAGGLEHNEYGYPTSTVEEHERMNHKRYRKFRHIRLEPFKYRYHGNPAAEIGVMGWGSSKGAIKEAVDMALKEGIQVYSMVPQLLYPIPYDPIQNFINPLKKLVVAELSFAAQFYKYLNSSFTLPDTHLMKRGGAMPLTAEEIYTKIQEVHRGRNNIKQ